MHNYSRCKDSHGNEASLHDLESMTEQFLVQAADVEDILRLGFGEYPEWTPSWNLLCSAYNYGDDFWMDLFKLAYPHLAALLQNEVPMLNIWPALLATAHSPRFAVQCTQSHQLPKPVKLRSWRRQKLSRTAPHQTDRAPPRMHRRESILSHVDHVRWTPVTNLLF